MTYSFQNPSQDLIYSYLCESKTIAVVGLSARAETVAYQVSQFMQAAGYRIIPVNPKAAGQEILGEMTYASLSEIAEPIDIVNVFRRSEFLAEVAEDFIKTDAKVYWAQLGLESQEAEAILRDAGKEHIVMNRCIKIEYLEMKQAT